MSNHSHAMDRAYANLEAQAHVTIRTAIKDRARDYLADRWQLDMLRNGFQASLMTAGQLVEFAKEVLKQEWATSPRHVELVPIKLINAKSAIIAGRYARRFGLFAAMLAFAFIATPHEASACTSTTSTPQTMALQSPCSPNIVTRNQKPSTTLLNVAISDADMMVPGSSRFPLKVQAPGMFSVIVYAHGVVTAQLINDGFGTFSGTIDLSHELTGAMELEIFAFDKAYGDPSYTVKLGAIMTIFVDSGTLNTSWKTIPPQASDAGFSSIRFIERFQKSSVTIPGGTWTVDGSGRCYLNGVWADYCAHVTTLLFYQNTIYANTDAYGWWQWTGSHFQQAAGDPRPGPTIPPATKLIDSTGGTWTVDNGGICYLNGVRPSNCGYVTTLLFYQSSIYADTTVYGWWQFVNNQFHQVAGDPRGGTTIPPATQIVVPGFVVPAFSATPCKPRLTWPECVAPTAADGFRWYENKPNGGDFGEAAFEHTDSPTRNPYSLWPAATGGSLRIRSTYDPNYVDPYGFRRHWYSGLLATAFPDATTSTLMGNGYYEARILVPHASADSGGGGTWPSFWMQTLNAMRTHCASGDVEQDVTEEYGNDPTYTQAGQHPYCGATGKDSLVYAGHPMDLAHDFHRHGYLITDTTVSYYLDDKLMATAPKDQLVGGVAPEWFLMLDLAMGGGWPVNAPPAGYYDMWIDYVRYLAP